MTLLVNEIFGPTIQGEGPSIGHPAAFLRLAGCNLACTWCDTAYSWDWKRYDKAQEAHKMTTDEVVLQVRKHLNPAPPMLVVTGGEPMLQQRDLYDVLMQLHHQLPLGFQVEVETAGTKVPEPALARLVHRFNVSLKLAHSRNPVGKRQVPVAITALRETGRATWKFVVGQPEQLSEVEELVVEYDLPDEDVWIMPLGTDKHELNIRMHHLAPAVIERGWRMTPRLHIQLWNNDRGH